VFATARRIRRPDGPSWLEQWKRTAHEARADAEKSDEEKHRVSACQAFLRASEYYRQAYFFIRSDIDDTRLQQTYAAHVETFDAALPLMDHAAERVRIPYDDTTLLGYFFAPDGSGTPRPTLLFPCGYDSTAQAGWVDVPAALARGYNALTFEGPGQGEALYQQHLYFRPDFEHVLTQVVDWVLARAEVDPARIGLVGRSFGGYLAPRGATGEHRIAALVCDPAQPDMGARIPHGLAARVAGPVISARMRLSAERAEFFGSRMAAHGVDTPAAWFDELRGYVMIDRAGAITCPVLIVETEHDFTAGGGQPLADALTAPAMLVDLTADRGTEGHCGGLGQALWARTVYDWLDDVLALR
jgi:hypothetical protein